MVGAVGATRTLQAHRTAAGRTSMKMEARKVEASQAPLQSSNLLPFDRAKRAAATPRAVETEARPQRAVTVTTRAA